MSPVSSIAIITAHSSESNLMDMIYHMFKTAVLPYLLTAAAIFNNYSCCAFRWTIRKNGSFKQPLKTISAPD